MTDPTHAMLEHDAATEWMGITVLEAEPGHARISMPLRAEMLNGFGIAHGGMVFALADTCFAMTCNDPAGDQETITVAQGVDINFLAPAADGQVLTAEGRQISSTGRSGLCDVVVTAEDGTTVAVFRGRSRTVRKH